MDTNNIAVAGNGFSSEAIEQQMARIFSDPRFNESHILKKFLHFVVHETLLGRANCLKEYTIALGVLDKSIDFNPQQNGIVRIHAGRLRRALSRYYDGLGEDDPIVITIPKGKYVPEFNGQKAEQSRQTESDHHSLFPQHASKFSLAILPFICPEKQELAKTFMDGLCMRLSSMLAHLEELSVIAYRAVSGLMDSRRDIKQLGLSAGFNHVITGNTQCTKDKLRVNIQLIDCFTYRLIWSETYDRQLTKDNVFEIQDEICQYAVNKVRELEESIDQHRAPVLSAI